MHSAPTSTLERAALLLPHQGPIGVFIHQNTLSALEHLDFQDALDHAEHALGARVRPTEEELRAMLEDGRIEASDLRAVFEAAEALRPEDDPNPTGGLCDARALRWAILSRGYARETWRVRAFRQAEGQGEAALLLGTPSERAAVREGCRRLLANARIVEIGRLLARTSDLGLATDRIRESLGLSNLAEVKRVLADDAEAERLGFKLLRSAAREHLERGRTERPERREVDAEIVHERVDDVLLPLLGGMLDLGVASWTPTAPDGLWAAALRHWLAPGSTSLEGWRRSLRDDLARLAKRTPEDALDAMLLELDPSGEVHLEILTALLHARQGWAGAVAWREHHRDGPRLVDYAATRLLLTIHASRGAGYLPLEILFARQRRPTDPGVLADRLAHALLYAGVPPDAARVLPDAAWQWLLALVLETGGRWRTKLLQEARERHSNAVFLQALEARRRLGPIAPATPEVQVIFCIDEREESMRRALEEAGGGLVETFGAAGFFGLPVAYRGLEEANVTARCPIVVTPTHRIEERLEVQHGHRRRLFGLLGARFERWSRTLLGGLVTSIVAGPFALLAAAARVVEPRASVRLLDRAAKRWAPPPAGRLVALREEGPGDLPLGFTLDEAAERVAGFLTGIGLTRGFAPLVVVLGHGSTSVNNPHASAYECGACGGFPGEANARAFAALANEPEVRARLRERLNIDVPDSCRFVGAGHDTASDAVRFTWPGAPDRIATAKALLDAARAANARERARRFHPSGRRPTGPESLLHVEGRAANPSQARPEYCHATNALLIVGPRAWTRGLFLDRRAFFQSYDPDGDPSGTILERLLAAVVPVCAGINLEYYFSRVDPERFGCGTKLPHNVVGLHGVMNGSNGDLRTGLPWQTVELHEPLRLLTVVLADHERVRSVIARSPLVQRYCRNRWIHLAAMDERGTWRWEGETFIPDPRPPVDLDIVESSADHYLGRIEPLEPVRVRRAEQLDAVPSRVAS